MSLNPPFSMDVPQTGTGDLAFFRDAVLLYSAAIRAEEPYFFSGSEKALELARWLGLKFENGKGERMECRSCFADPAGLGSASLQSFRDKGYLGTALFSAFVRSSYGPEESGFYPTQSELSFYFDEHMLLEGGVRWDQEYLEECQAFFFEELTPHEILGLTLCEMPEWASQVAENFESQLLGVAFLIAEKQTSLVPLTSFLTALLEPQASVPDLGVLLKGISDWTSAGVHSAWEALPSSLQASLSTQLFSALEGQIPEVILACGEELMVWRRGS